MKLFDYTKWEVLEVYEYNGRNYCVQVRMNKKTGFKHFSVNSITGNFHGFYKRIEIVKINELTKQSQ